MPKLSLAVRIVLSCLLIFLPLANLDQWFYDHWFRLSGKKTSTSSITLVRVSESKLLRLTEQGHFPSEAYAIQQNSHSIWLENFYEALIKKIQDSGAKLIVFTSFYDWVETRHIPRSPSIPVVYSAIINDDSKLVPPPKRLSPDENYGFNNLFPDPDNTVRQTPLLYSSGKSLALRTYTAIKGSLPNRNLVDPLWIDFRGPAGSFSSMDAWDLWEGTGPWPSLQGKVVLIGREGSPASDLITPFGQMSRLEVQANVIETLLTNKEIHFFPQWSRWVISLAVVGLSVAIILFFPLNVAWFLLLMFALSFCAGSLISLKLFKFWVGLSTPLVCILGTHLFLVGYRLSRQEEEQWKLQQESLYLKGMDEFKNNFISLFSHDLKTPIAKIKAITDRLLLKPQNLSEDVTEGLKAIDRTSSELARLISDILKVTKMESMSLEPAREVVDINRLVENAIQRLRFLADEKKISVLLDLEPPFSMEGDPQLLGEVITNLVENALKYSPPGTQVIVKTREGEEGVEVTVKDQGPGIPFEELPRITTKFYRGKQASIETMGSGLGLYLAKYFVELHHGRLEIKSRPGEGTEVKFWLPIGS